MKKTEKETKNKVKNIRWTNMEIECFYGSYVEAVHYASKKARETGLEYIIA